MTRTLIAALAASVALAAPAFANDSLARSLGVDAGVYTSAQLVALKAAQDDDNHSRINQIKAEVEAGGYNASPDFSQLAVSIDAEGYAADRIVALKAAGDDDDASRITNLRNVNTTASDVTVSTRGGSSAEQLSRSLGVAPGALTTGQLVRLASAQADDDHFEISKILAEVN